jgi:hypothetical protein
MFWAERSRMLSGPSGPGQEDWMTLTFKLERLDGTPADPPSFETTVLRWQPGDTIPLSAKRTLQVVRIRDGRCRPGARPGRSGRGLKSV